MDVNLYRRRRHIRTARVGDAVVEYVFSRYVSLVDVDDGVVLMVGGTGGAVLGVDASHRHDLERALGDNDPSWLPIWVREQLRQARMIVRREADELAVLSLQRQLVRADRRTLSLTIAPTMHCNLSCPYCYERGGKKSGPMPRYVQDRVIAMAARELQPGGKLAVTWYGGEPLLARDAIDRLSAGLAAACSRIGASYSCDIVTNGTLMTPATISWMLATGISSAQVTVDGPAHVHDRRRAHRDGHGTFATIVDNLQHAVAMGMKVAVRVNIDQSNADDALVVIDFLYERGLLPGVRMIAGQVTGGESGVCVGGGCLDNEEFAAVRGRFDAHALKYSGLAVRPLAFRTLYCGAEAMGAMVIDPDGHLYKCWRDAGQPARSFGLVGMKWELDHPNLLCWLGRPDPTADPKCSKCAMLPLCMGGCPARSMAADADCDVIRHLLPTILGQYYRAVVSGGGGQR